MDVEMCISLWFTTIYRFCVKFPNIRRCSFLSIVLVSDFNYDKFPEDSVSNISVLFICSCSVIVDGYIIIVDC